MTIDTMDDTHSGQAEIAPAFEVRDGNGMGILGVFGPGGTSLLNDEDLP